jgi:phosphinothricin acetyltransferase
MNIVECDLQAHGEQMLDIVNEAIAGTTWVYDYSPRTSGQMAEWVADRRAGGFPVIVAEDGHQRLLGFGSFGRFRHLPGYKYTAEHSVFVDQAARRKGVGTQLLERLIELARGQDLHVLIGAIDSTNLPSIALHESLGFELCGTMREVGFKSGRWLDALFYQLVLATPLAPAED